MTKIHNIVNSLGSSHVCRFAVPDRHVAYVGIRGGTSEHVKEFLRKKSYLDLNALTDIVVLVGGNQLSRLQNNEMVPDQTADQVRESIENLVRFVKTRCPFAAVFTMDLLPRVSTKSWFDCRARIVNTHIKQIAANHHHVRYFQYFVVMTRSKTGERLPPARELISHDGVHLRDVGYAAIRRITDWLTSSRRVLGERLEFVTEGISITVDLKF